MSKRDKYKLLSIPIAVFAGIISCRLSDVLLTWQPDTVIITLLIIILLAMLAISAIFIHSRFWKQWPPTGLNVITWIFISMLILLFVGMNLWTSIEVIKAIQLQHFGIPAEAVIVDRWTEVFRDSEYHVFTYQWSVIHDNNRVIEYVGKEDAPLSWSTQTSPGARITIRYLPEHPAVARVEENFADAPEDMLGFFLFMNLYIMLTFPVYFWLERPKQLRQNM